MFESSYHIQAENNDIDRKTCYSVYQEDESKAHWDIIYKTYVSFHDVETI